jgi:hypothetical protein
MRLTKTIFLSFTIPTILITQNSVNPQGVHTTDFPVWTTVATGKEPWQNIQP